MDLEFSAASAELTVRLTTSSEFAVGRAVIAAALACIPVVIWLYLLLARGSFWRIARQLAPWPPDPHLSKSIVAVIPARNEAAGIAATVSSVLTQNFGGAIHVIVVDDESSDGTAEIATNAAAALGSSNRLTVIRGKVRPPGWTGKVWAMAQGVEATTAMKPDYLLFTDADIEHEPDSIAALVTNAERFNRDLVSYMVKLSALTLAERWLIPAFVFFFLKLYPPAWVAEPRSATAAAAGGCVLIRPRALERIGGLAAIRSAIIDDCALARAVKHSGGKIWLGLTPDTRSLRVYGSAAEIGQMISRTAFNQLGHSYSLLALTLLGLLLTYILPPLLLLTHDRVLISLGVASWAIMSACYWPMVRFYRVSALWSVCLPAIALFYGGATLHSALQYTLGRGGQWKGRVQDVRTTGS